MEKIFSDILKSPCILNQTGGFDMRGSIRCAKRGCDRVRKSLTCEHCGHPTCYVSVFWHGRHYKFWRDLNGNALIDYRRATNLLAIIHSRINDPKALFNPEEFLASNIAERKFTAQVKVWLDLKTEEAEAGELSFETLKNYRGYAKYYWTYFNDFDVREIRTNNIEDFISSLRFANIKIKTRKNILNGLHVFFGWLKQKGTQKGGIAELPAWPAIKGDDSRLRTAIDYETQQYGLEHIPAEHKDIFEFGFETGLRPGELCALQAGDIDLKQHKVLIQRTWSGSRLRETTKAKIKKFIPLSQRAMEIASKQCIDKLPGAFLFINSQTKSWYRPKKLNQIWRQFSSLNIDHYSAGRHSFCTQIIQSGANIFDAQELMRHTDINSTRQYYHASTKRLEEIVNNRGKVQHLQNAKQNGSRTRKEAL